MAAQRLLDLGGPGFSQNRHFLRQEVKNDGKRDR